jgi:hypothetical protein
MASKQPQAHYSAEGGVAVITLDYPPLNALHPQCRCMALPSTGLKRALDEFVQIHWCILMSAARRSVLRRRFRLDAGNRWWSGIAPVERHRTANWLRCNTPYISTSQSHRTNEV